MNAEQRAANQQTVNTKRAQLAMEMHSYLQAEGYPEGLAGTTADPDQKIKLLAEKFGDRMIAITALEKAPNVSAAMRERVRRGFINGRPPFGYRAAHAPSESHLAMVPNADGELVRQLFEQLAAHPKASAADVATQLGLKKGRSQVYNILRNQLYRGVIVLKGEDGQPDEHITGKFEPLVSAEVFDQVQVKLNTRR